MPEWLPTTELKLVALAEKWIEVLENEKTITKWHLDATSCATVVVVIKVYTAAWYLCQKDDSTLNKTARREAKKLAVDAMRLFARTNLRFNEYMDEADKLLMGLPQRDVAATTHPRPTSLPETIVENTVNPFEKRLRVLNRETHNAKKPADAYGVRYGWQLDGTKPASGDDLPKSRFSRRTDLVISFTEKEAGKPIWFATCYENAKGETGPWSPLVETHIW